MTSTSLLDAWDAIAGAETLLERLNAAAIDLSRKQGLKDEKAWLNTALERLTAAREGQGDLRARAMCLPELESLREEHARVLQNAVVDVVERLQAGITFQIGSRAPLLEVLYGKLKVPVLRRCDREDFEAFCKDFEKRLNSSYAKRMFGEPAFGFVIPAVEQVYAAIAAWRSGWAPPSPSEEEARAVRDELEAAARRLDLPSRQARLLAEAALAPLRNAFDESGIGQKPRRRSSKPAVTEGQAADSSEEPEADEPAPEQEAAPEPAPEIERAPELVPEKPAKKRKAKQA